MRTLAPACGALLLSLLWLAAPADASAEEGAPGGGIENRLNCLRRIARVAGLEWRPLVAEVGDADPRARLDEWLDPSHDPTSRTPFYQKGFSRAFATFFAGMVNRETPADAHEGIYAWAAAWILHNKLPWKSLFTSRSVCRVADSYSVVCEERPDAPAIGVFNSPIWQKVYLGAAPDGAAIRAANNMIKAMIGKVLVPSAANMVGDNSASGRQRPECAGCHYTSPYALDHVAALLPFRRESSRFTVAPQVPTPQTLLNGRTFASAEELTQAVTDSDHFRFWTCQLLFQYATGRPPRACEWQTFDACMTVMRASGELRAAIKPIVLAADFCAEDP